eukprot:CAMPEP_0115831712 /NCGR_PEP_ID=MMETSP0287-20121206/2281_1 /TAXON_ID=412157 /ORGANISM="Chrysochromulina rotalis, Strain UIO044" /LENGTH=363 /DNA_ID=CAMNT_0003285069 /DNA_START=124 /DNA_END=1215 /DNA_ORIENTATION=-
MKRTYISADRKKALRKAFNNLDEDHDGILNIREMRAPFKQLGIDKDAIRNLDDLNFDAFCEVILGEHDSRANIASQDRPGALEVLTSPERFPFSLAVNTQRISRMIDELILPEDEPSVANQRSRRSTMKQVGSLPAIKGGFPSKSGTDLKQLERVKHSTLNRAGDLAKWLQLTGVNTSQWGKGSAKSISDLHAEIQGQECSLEVIDKRCFRIVSVVKMLIRPIEQTPSNYYGPESHLVEYQQKMSDGRVREHNGMPSKKMHDGESPIDAAKRGISEEFGDFIPEGAINVLADTLTSWYELVESATYPTLRTQYRLHRVQVDVEGLPSSFLTSEGSKEHFRQFRTSTEGKAKAQQLSGNARPQP